MKLADWLTIIEDLYKKQELEKDILENFKIFRDWLIDNEPIYVELIDLLIEGKINIKFCNEFKMNLPERLISCMYFKYITAENLSILFEETIKMIKSFDEATHTISINF